MFDPRGQFVKLAARRGQGPGEILAANGMINASGTIWVNDRQNGRWNAYAADDGRYLRQHALSILSYGYLWEVGVDDRGRMIDYVLVPTGRRDPATNQVVNERRVRRVAVNGGVTDTVSGPGCPAADAPARPTFVGTGQSGNMVIGIPYLPRPQIAFDGSGTYWCAPNDGYAILRRSIGRNDTVQIIRQAYRPLSVPATERDSAINAVKKALSAYEKIDANFALVPATHPVFVRILTDDQRRLWALRTTPRNSIKEFDLYDAAGMRLATVTTTIPFVTARPMVVAGDAVYGIVLDSDDVPYVVRARIVR